MPYNKTEGKIENFFIASFKTQCRIHIRPSFAVVVVCYIIIFVYLLKKFFPFQIIRLMLLKLKLVIAKKLPFRFFSISKKENKNNEVRKASGHNSLLSRLILAITYYLTSTVYFFCHFFVRDCSSRSP